MRDTIGIIGSGMIGGQVARLATAAGLEVMICNTRGPETLADLVTELGAKARAGTLANVLAETDIVVLAIPFGAYGRLSPDDFRDKIVIDTLNYYPERDGVMAEVRTDVIATSELLQQHLARSKVVRAINNLDFVRLLSRARPAGAPDRSALPIAGDDATAKAAVVSLLDAIGYDTVDMGLLSESWRSEPTMPIYVNPYWGIATVYESGPDDVASFMTAPGRVVDKAEATALLAAAVRHDRMHGSLGNFALADPTA